MKPNSNLRPVEVVPTALRTFVGRYVQPTAPDYAHLAGMVQEQYFSANTSLAQAGTPCEQVHLVLSGVARQRCLRTGEDHTVGFCLPGRLLTDVTGFLTDRPGSFDLLAVTPLHTVSLSYAQVQQLYHANPLWERCGRLIVEAHMLHLTRRAISLQLKPAAVRYAELMKAHPELFNLVPLHQLASYLGIAKETLSRLRRHQTTTDKQGLIPES